MDSLTHVPTPRNEPVLSYDLGTPERAALASQLADYLQAPPADLFGRYDRRRASTGQVIDVTMPSDHRHILGRVAQTTPADAQVAIDTACAAAPGWAELDFDSRAAIFLRAADLITGEYRARMNAATMLGQGKTVQQAEIDAVGELADFLRFNVAYAQVIQAVQPDSVAGAWNRADYRPLEGFVYAITPFNFTSIAGNLPTAPAIMGNVCLWKPAVSQQFAADVFLDVLDRVGLPAGVITMVPGHGSAVSDVALADPRLAGVHFTGSTRVFQGLWAEVGRRLAGYRTYPRLVGETGGKDFVLVHPSADRAGTIAALTRGGFEYSGQKCSAASRAYIARSVWRDIEADLIDTVAGLKVGPVEDFTSFTSAVIDQRAYRRLSAAIEAARAEPSCQIVVGGGTSDAVGWYVDPTIVVSSDPTWQGFSTEYFGPLLTVYVYDDADWQDTLTLVDQGSAYALTGSVLARDRAAIVQADRALRQAAGNFYINDKPTGAVINQQPFGGARASGTNDKAGSVWNLMRWTSPRVIKEALTVPTAIGYSHMVADDPEPVVP